MQQKRCSNLRYLLTDSFPFRFVLNKIKEGGGGGGGSPTTTGRFCDDNVRVGSGGLRAVDADF